MRWAGHVARMGKDRAVYRVLVGKFVLLIQYCAGDKIEIYEMGWACGAYGSGERGAQGLGGETGGKETTGEIQAQMGG